MAGPQVWSCNSLVGPITILPLTCSNDTFSLNAGVDDADSLGWSWKPLNSGKPISIGEVPASQVVFGDIDGYVLTQYHGSGSVADFK